MEIYAIGIDLGKMLFHLVVSIHAEAWSSASGVPAASCWPTPRTCESNGSAWKPAVVPIFSDGPCAIKATAFRLIPAQHMLAQLRPELDQLTARIEQMDAVLQQTAKES